MEKKNVLKVYLMLVTTFFLWGSIYVATRYLSVVGMPSTVIVCGRNLIGVVPLYFMARGSRGVKIAKEDRKYFVLVAVMGYYGTFLINMMGVARAGASVSALINTVNPVTISVLAAVILKEPIRRIQVVCIVLALVGAYVVLAGAESSGQFFGLVLILLSVVTWSIASVYIRRLGAKYPPVLITFYGMGLSLVFHIPTAAWTVVQQGGIHMDGKAILLLLYLGVLASGMAQFLWSRSLSLLPATTCSLFYPLQPVFSAILGVIFLGETFGPNFWIGMVIIGGDIILNCLDGMKHRAAPEN